MDSVNPRWPPLQVSSSSFPNMAAAAAAAASRAIVCELGSQRSPSTGAAVPSSPVPRVRTLDLSTASGASGAGKNIVLQPRLSTLRSYGSGAVRAPARDGEQEEQSASQFFASLADYVESARRSHDFEIISGRLAMIAFAAAVSVELVTGDSLFKKLDLQQMEEAAGVCVAVVACAATFAWFSSERTRIGQMFTLGCNRFVDALVDNIVEALFNDDELSEWSDKM